MKPEILISKLKHSNKPIVLVEGKDDMVIYRKIEKLLGWNHLQFFPCNGRENLFKIYESRSELSNTIVIFIADRDMFVFSPIPTQYEDIIFTSGYSIENDLYRDGKNQLQSLLYDSEIVFKKEFLKNVIDWFAFEINIRLVGKNQDNQFSNISLLSEKISFKYSVTLTESLLENRGFHKIDNEELVKNINDNYELILRGKFIFQIYQKINRDFRMEKEDTTYTKEQFWDMCFHAGKDNDESCMKTLINKIKLRLKSSN